MPKKVKSDNEYLEQAVRILMYRIMRKLKLDLFIKWLNNSINKNKS